MGTMVVLVAPANWAGGRAGERAQRELMRRKDGRVRAVMDSLLGMRAVKLMAWEQHFEAAIGRERKAELSALGRTFKVQVAVDAFFAAVPYAVVLVSFGVFCLVRGTEDLTADRIFVSLSLFNIIKFLFMLFPSSLMDAIRLFVSFRRMDDFLAADEVDVDAAVSQEVTDVRNSLEISDGDFSWLTVGENVLEDIALEVPRGSLVAVVGAVGAGKTSLLAAALGEMEKNRGRVSLSRGASLAYVPQRAWIRNATVERNVTFNRPYSRGRFQQVVRSCALDADLELMPAGSDTEIGENGVNLSRGQKQRVSLARAAYSDADVFLLDDPLSALDMHVGKHVFERLLSSETGLLREKTRVLVTNNLGFLHRTDRIYVLRSGRIVEEGTFEELSVGESELSRFLQASASNSSERKEEIVSDSQGATSKNDRVDYDRVLSHDNERSDGHDDDDDDDNSREGGRLVRSEAVAEGHVGSHVYLRYLKSFGPLLFLLISVLYLVGQVLQVGTGLVLASWADANGGGNGTHQGWPGRYLGSYAGLALGDSGLQLAREIWLLLVCCRVSSSVHANLLDAVFRSPMSFFDQNPTGRILNRFSADVNSVDQVIPVRLSQLLRCVSEVAATLALVCYSVPLVAAVFVPLAAFYVYVQRYFTSTSSQLERMDYVSRSPILSHFSETWQGVTSIR